MIHMGCVWSKKAQPLLILPLFCHLRWKGRERRVEIFFFFYYNSAVTEQDTYKQNNREWNSFLQHRKLQVRDVFEVGDLFPAKYGHFILIYTLFLSPGRSYRVLFVLLLCCVALQRVSIYTWCCRITELKDGLSHTEFKFKPGETRFSQRGMKKIPPGWCG